MKMLMLQQGSTVDIQHGVFVTFQDWPFILNNIKYSYILVESWVGDDHGAQSVDTVPDHIKRFAVART